MQRSFIEKLRNKLQDSLPGQEAQYRMAHVGRRQAPLPPAHAREAGVLALFFPKKDNWHLVLIERVRNHNDRHSGQISFPGGRYEPADGSLVNTALREAEEEIGIDAGKVKVLGQLTELYIPVSNFQVNPFVGYVDYRPAFRPEESEVAAVLEVPLTLLTQPETVQRINLQVTENIILQEVPHYNVFGKVVWGATAMMLSELLTILREVEE